MDEFELPVTYNGEELLLPGRLLKYAYSYKIEVTVDGEKILFEPDEEGRWRGITEKRINKKINKTKIAAITKSIEESIK